MKSVRCHEFDEGLRSRRPLEERWRWVEGLTGVEDCIAEGLRHCSGREDWLGFELYVIAAQRHPSRAYTETLCQVLAHHDIEDFNYEDIVGALDAIRDPASVGCLRDTLWWEPEWDEFREMAVKCVHALGVIGTSDALAAIREALTSESPEVSRAA